MKTIISSLDTRQMPNVYYNIKRDVLDFFNKYKNDTPPSIYNGGQRGNIYFLKHYPLDLWGWSGLDNWFRGLLKRKVNNKLPLFNNIYLDPHLCLRKIQDTGKQKQFVKNFWNNKNLQLKDSRNTMQISVMICDFIPNEGIGKYQQQQMMITLSYQQLKDVKTIQKFLVHQFVHFLDHLTGVIIKDNIDSLLQHQDLFLPENQQFEVYKTYTQKRNPNENIDIKQYYAELQQLSEQFDQIGKDCAYRFREYYIPTNQILLYFCYLTEYNVYKRKFLQRSKLEQALIEKKQQNMVDNFQYLYSQVEHKNFQFQIKNLGEYAIQQIYKRYKTTYLVTTSLSKEILNVI